MKKRILSILLSVAVAIAMIPATGAVAFAESSLYVGGQLISADSTPVEIGGGTVSYDGKALTLDNVDLDYDSMDPGAAIYCDGGLIIETKGDCSINSVSKGISTVGALEITEGSSLKIGSYYEAVDVMSDDKGEDIPSNGTFVNNGTIAAATEVNGITCNTLTNNGSISLVPYGYATPTEGILANSILTNNGTIQCEDYSFPILAQELNQNDGTIEVGGTFTKAISCVNFVQTSGTIDIANNGSSSSLDGIYIDDMENGTFEVSGGNLNIDLSADASTYFNQGIYAEASAFQISGGKINISLVGKQISMGIAITGTEPVITGGDLTISVDSEGSEYVTLAYVLSDDADADSLSLSEPEGMTITASNNADGSSPVAYDPAKVWNGYKYLHVAPLHKHSWDEGTVTVQPTCTEPGTKTFTCAGCSETKTEEIAATGHTSVAIAAKKATMTADGKTAGSKCSVCGKILTAQKTVYKASTVKIAASKAYTGKALKPAVTIKDSKGNAIAAANYSVKYTNNTKVGKATATVTFKNNYTGSKKLPFKIKPKKASVKSAVPGKKRLKVTAGTKVAATGGAKYKIAYKVKGTSTWKYKTTANKTLTIKSLKKGKKYQVKIQAIKSVNGTTYKGAWSAVKTTNKIK